MEPLLLRPTAFRSSGEVSAPLSMRTTCILLQGGRHLPHFSRTTESVTYRTPWDSREFKSITEKWHLGAICNTFYIKTRKRRVVSPVPTSGPRARGGPVPPGFCGSSESWNLTSETGRRRAWQNSNIQCQGSWGYQTLAGAGTMNYFNGCEKTVLCMRTGVQAYQHR